MLRQNGGRPPGLRRTLQRLPAVRRKGERATCGMEEKSPDSGLTGPVMATKDRLALFAHHGFGHNARTQTAGTDGQSANTAIRKLVTHALKIGVEAALGLDIGMAHEIANLGLFAAEIAFLAHTILRICKKQFISNAAKPWPGL